MARSFYENQHQAKRKTTLLVVYFLLAVVLIVVAVTLVVYATLFFAVGAFEQSLMDWLRNPISWWIAGGTLGVILAGSLFRALQLGSNGARVAQMAGGLPIDMHTTDPLQRRLINVTEEMAIASGTHMPKLYLLRNESGINAFVAGLGPNHTVLAVTQGALGQLDRTELQGVIGHEFSHILNGDVRINMRLIAILAGILLIGQVGEFLMRGSSHRRYSSRSRSKEENSMALLGLALMVIGYIGLFFGRLIKSAISRQREFLADASSVQFTRDPFAIGGALFKIDNGTLGSYLNDRHAEEINHLCFSETLGMSFSRWLASHPPIEDRLKALDPSMPARLRSRARLATKQQENPAEASQPSTAGTPASASALGAMGFADDAPLTVPARQVKASIGTTTTQQADAAHQLMHQLPEDLREQVHHPQGAELLLYALVLTTMRSHGAEALTCLRERRSERVASETATCYRRLRETPVPIRLPLLDIALATLAGTPSLNQQNVRDTLAALIAVDDKVSMTEFVIQFLADKFLTERQPPKVRYRSFTELDDALQTLYSALSLASGTDDKEQHATLTQSLAVFGLTPAPQSQPLQPPTTSALRHAFQQLGQLTPLLKQPVLDTCIDAVMADDKVTPREAELLRAISLALDCPMPLMVATDTPTPSR